MAGNQITVVKSGPARQALFIPDRLFIIARRTRGIIHAGALQRFPHVAHLFRQLAERQWIENTDGRICLTSEGMGYSDYIGQLFITPEIRGLMETYSY